MSPGNGPSGHAAGRYTRHGAGGSSGGAAGPVVTGALEERAPAKINLTLEVLGRRPDGYHELVSLVAFAAAGAADVVALAPGEPLRLEIAGPGAGALAGDPANLVLAAAAAALEAEPGLATGAFRLEKQLPVAAGIGGGSADAAAALRLIERASPRLASAVDWHGVAARIGADVPVCLDPKARVMTGTGATLGRPVRLPLVWAVLANPGVPLPTAAVFKALAAPPMDRAADAPDTPMLASLADLFDYMRARPNGLQATAERLCPAVAATLAALSGLQGACVARMSGSGPTCFALFATEGEAEAGALRLRSRHPAWWVAAAPLA